MEYAAWINVASSSCCEVCWCSLPVEYMLRLYTGVVSRYRVALQSDQDALLSPVSADIVMYLLVLPFTGNSSCVPKLK